MGGGWGGWWMVVGWMDVVDGWVDWWVDVLGGLMGGDGGWG